MPSAAPASSDSLAELRAALALPAAPDRAQLTRWVADPDPRVPLTLVREGADHLRQDEGLKTQLQTRALLDAQVDGVMWNPLLDAMLVADCWPLDQGLVSPTEQLSSLGTWLTAPDRTEAEVLQLLAFEHPLIRPTVARALERWTPALIARVAADPASCALLAENSRVDAHELAWLATWAAEALASGDPARVRGAGPVITVLRRRGHDALAAELVRAALEQAPSTNVLPPDSDARVLRDAVVDTLLATPTLTPSELTTLYRRIARDSARMVRLVRHPALEQPLWRRIMADAPGPIVERALASHPRAVHDPELWAAMMRSRSPAVLRALLPHASKAEVAALRARIAERDDVDAHTPPDDAALPALDADLARLEAEHVAATEAAQARRAPRRRGRAAR